jgi:hypothetical protein
MVILNLIRSLYFGTLTKTILLITPCYRLLDLKFFGSHPISSVTGGEQLPVICFIDSLVLYLYFNFIGRTTELQAVAGRLHLFSLSSFRTKQS